MNQVSCLEDCADYAQLNGKNLLLRKQWYIVAILPFVFTLAFDVYLLPRFVPETKFWHGFASALIYASLVWGFAVPVYLLAMFVRVKLFRCPRCGHRFGGGESCGSCDFPRSKGVSSVTSL